MEIGMKILPDGWHEYTNPHKPPYAKKWEMAWCPTNPKGEVPKGYVMTFHGRDGFYLAELEHGSAGRDYHPISESFPDVESAKAAYVLMYGGAR